MGAGAIVEAYAEPVAAGTCGSAAGAVAGREDLGSSAGLGASIDLTCSTGLCTSAGFAGSYGFGVTTIGIGPTGAFAATETDAYFFLREASIHCSRSPMTSVSFISFLAISMYAYSSLVASCAKVC